MVYFIKSTSTQQSLFWLLVALCSVTLIYLGPLQNVYLFADEMNILDPELREHSYSSDIWKSLYFWTKVAGRPVSALVIVTFADAFLTGETGLQMLRGIALLASLAGLCAVFYLLRILRVAPMHAALLVVFLWSQPAFAVHHAYLLLLPYWIGMYCAFVVCALFHARRDRPFGKGEAILYVILFGIALLTFQTTPFVALPFLALMALVDKEGQYTKRIALLFGTLLGTVALYSVCFKLGSMFTGLGSYRKARNLMTPDTLNDFVGSGYLRIFEFWNYLLPIRLETAQKDMLNLAVLFLLLGLCFAAMRVEIRASKPVARRWGLVLAIFGASLVPILAESGGDRQHMAVAAVLTWVLIAYQSIIIVAGSVPRPRLKIAAGLLVVSVAVGANLGLSRSIIEPNKGYLHMVQQSFQTDDIMTESLQILIYLPPEEPYVYECHTEPCTGFFGRRVPTSAHAGRAGFYTFAAVVAGADAPTELNISFLPAETRRDSAIQALKIDWSQMIADDF